MCCERHAPIIRIRNNGEQTLNSLDITYSIDGVTEGTTSWTGALEYTETADVTLADIAPADGNHTFSFHSVQSQWFYRPKHIERHGDSDFFMNSSGSGVTISVGGGSWDSEIGWSWI